MVLKRHRTVFELVLAYLITFLSYYFFYLSYHFSYLIFAFFYTCMCLSKGENLALENNI